MLSTHSQQPSESIQLSSGPKTQHVWPTYYPSGGRTYLLDGIGIFVDPDTGVGLSLWIDPDMQDILGLIKAIWVSNILHYPCCVSFCVVLTFCALIADIIFVAIHAPIFIERGRSCLTIP